MSIRIGDFLQSKQYPKTIYHVDNFSINLKKAANLKKEMFIICSELLADTNGSDKIENSQRTHCSCFILQRKN